MRTICEVAHHDGDTWTYCETDGEYNIHYVVDADEPTGRVTLTLPPQVLLQMAANLRSNITPIHDARQKIIDLPARRRA